MSVPVRRIGTRMHWSALHGIDGASIGDFESTAKGSGCPENRYTVEKPTAPRGPWLQAFSGRKGKDSGVNSVGKIEIG